MAPEWIGYVSKILLVRKHKCPNFLDPYFDKFGKDSDRT
jgi:hypothetical protein